MAKVISLQHGLKFLVWMIVAMVVLYAGGGVSDTLAASPSVGLRWLGVAAAVVSLLPWLSIIIWPLTHLDEYHRRVVLVGTAVSFIVDLLVHTGFNVIVDAHLGGPTSLPALPVAMGIWVISVGLTSLYYRATV